MMRDYKTEKNRLYLFSKPSFLTGIARLIDVFRATNKYNTSNSDQQADYDALYSDWLAIGDDIWKATEKYSESIRK